MVTAAASPAVSAPASPAVRGAASQAVHAPAQDGKTQAPIPQFREVYQSVPIEENSNGESSPPESETGQQHGDSKSGNPKRPSRDGNNDKTAITPPVFLGNPLSRSPLVLALPTLGQEADGKPENTGHDPQETTTPGGQTDTAPQTTPSITSTPAPASPVALPAASSLAFSIRLKPESPPATTQTASQSAPQNRIQPPNTSAARESQHSTVQQPGAPPPQEPQSVTPVKNVNPTTDGTSDRALATANSVPDARPSTSIADAPEVSRPLAAAAVHEVQAILPESPKAASANQEILLHLPGTNQSVAAVRLVDRSGTVNVSVHASDPELRTSLRSNLSDLASQLNGQGFKTEVIKPAVIAAHADNAQDSRHDGQRSANQQQQSPTPGDRQPQRDRRANSSRWLEELNQKTSGNPDAEGGSN